VQRHGHLEVAEGVLESAAQVLAVRAHALFMQPRADLGVADDQRIAAFCDGKRVTNVIVVAVRYQDEISLHIRSLLAGSRVAAEKGVHQQRKAAGFQPQGSMSIPGQLGAHGIRLACGKPAPSAARRPG
jgi:hypothetical protein